MQIVRKTWVLSSFSVSVFVSLSLSLCVVVVVEGGRGRRRETTRTIWLLIPARASLKIAETEQLYQVKRMIGGIGDMLFSIYSQTEHEKDPRGSFVCRFKTSPYVPAPRPHVVTHVRVVPVHTGTF